MAKPTKILKDFWQSHRREVRLEKSELLSTRAEEKRLKLHFTMPLSNIPPTHMPEDFIGPFGLMEKETSPINETRIDVILKGMTVDLFPLMKSKTPDRIITQSGATLQGFKLVGEGEGDKRKVNLVFLAYLPHSSSLYEACDIYHHKTVYLEAAYSQSEMDFDGEGDGEDAEEGKDQDDDDPRTAAPPPGRGRRRSATAVQ
jgi:hypothetical protein